MLPMTLSASVLPSVIEPARAPISPAIAPHRRSITSLTTSEIARLAKDAGQQAFRTAIDSGVAVPILVGHEVVTVIKSTNGAAATK